MGAEAQAVDVVCHWRSRKRSRFVAVLGGLKRTQRAVLVHGEAGQPAKLVVTDRGKRFRLKKTDLEIQLEDIEQCACTGENKIDVQFVTKQGKVKLVALTILKETKEAIRWKNALQCAWKESTFDKLKKEKENVATNEGVRKEQPHPSCPSSASSSSPPPPPPPPPCSSSKSRTTQEYNSSWAESIPKTLRINAALQIIKCGDDYKVLGVTRFDDVGCVRKAYLRLAKQWHPDKSPCPIATECFVRIQSAFEKLQKNTDRIRLVKNATTCSGVRSYSKPERRSSRGPRYCRADSRKAVKRAKSGIDLSIPPTEIRAGSSVERFSRTNGRWVPATVKSISSFLDSLVLCDGQTGQTVHIPVIGGLTLIRSVDAGPLSVSGVLLC